MKYITAAQTFGIQVTAILVPHRPQSFVNFTDL